MNPGIPKTLRHRRLTFLGFVVGLGLALGSPSAFAAGGVEKLQEFPLDQVQIIDAYEQNLFKKEMAYLLTAIDSDRLMAGFKAVSQNVTPTNLYGGWESQNIRGHGNANALTVLGAALPSVDASPKNALEPSRLTGRDP